MGLLVKEDATKKQMVVMEGMIWVHPKATAPTPI